jgi:hypothetical protein
MDLDLSKYLPDMFSEYASLGFTEGYRDLCAIIHDNPIQTLPVVTPTDWSASIWVPMSSMAFNLANTSTGKHLAGASMDIGTLSLKTSHPVLNIDMPMLASPLGYVEPFVDFLWGASKYAPFGMGLSAVGKMTTQPTIGGYSLIIDNIADFVDLVGETVYIIDSEGSAEENTIESVNKSDREIILEEEIQLAHTTSSYIVARIIQPNDPIFSIYSLREGLLSPCLVNKLNFTASMDNTVTMNAEIYAQRVIRGYQVNIRENLKDIRASYEDRVPLREIDGAMVYARAYNSASGTFGMPIVLGNELFSGYQGALAPNTITSISLDVQNNLKPIFSMWSRASGSKRLEENSIPIGFYSEGRKISGSIKFNMPVNAWAVAEKIAGSSGANSPVEAMGGLEIDFGACIIQMPEIAWQPSSGSGSMDQEQQRTLEWTMLGDVFNAMPELKLSVQG